MEKIKISSSVAFNGAFFKANGKIYFLDGKTEKVNEESESITYEAIGLEITKNEYENADLLRSVLYRELADPLFFKFQRGEIEEQIWLDKAAEIKAI